MTTRRHALVLFGSAMLGLVPGFGRRAAANLEDSEADQQKFGKWMDDWIDAQYRRPSKPAHGTLGVTRFADAFWYLTREISWSPLPGVALPSVVVPVGFVTDFASIPRSLWTLLPRDGDYVWAAIVHDYLYWSQGTSKADADSVFNAAMEDFKIPAVERIAIYEGVSRGGQSSWDENARLKRAGEKRILKLFPPEPTISWADWKKRPDVF
jgi:hypothetical protein